MKKGRRYGKTMARQMYLFFIGYSDVGAPSFSKFARSVGAALEDIERWREHTVFERAYRECSEIRRDYLIDNALCKRFDASVVKFLLTNEFKMEENAAADAKRVDVVVEVLE